jgi:hypothetical protein
MDNLLSVNTNMAASIDPKMACTPCRAEQVEELLDLLSTQFLEMVPVRRMKWTVRLYTTMSILWTNAFS